MDRIEQTTYEINSFSLAIEAKLDIAKFWSTTSND